MQLLKPDDLDPDVWIQAHACMGKAESRFDLRRPDGHQFDMESFRRFAERDVLCAVDDRDVYLGHVDIWRVGSDRLRLGYEFGSFCPLHLDRPDAVDWHFLMVVDHHGERVSKLRLHLPESELDWQGEPGDVIVFPGSVILHERTPLAEGEKVRMLAVGFKVASTERNGQVHRVD